MLKRNIQKTLSACVINPKTDTSYRFVVDLNNSAYCITKAMDLLNGINLNKIDDSVLKQAITLLAIARVTDGSDSPKQTRVPRKRKNRVSSDVQSLADFKRDSGDSASAPCDAF